MRCTFFAIGCLLTLSACAPFPSTTPVAPEISGMVRDAKTGRGIPGVHLVAQRADYTREAWSKPDGTYVLPGITQWHYLWYLGDPGVTPPPWWIIHSRMSPYEISAEKPGYVRRGISFVPDEERKAHWDFVLEPAKNDGAVVARKAP